jgi:hypothetical protein
MTFNSPKEYGGERGCGFKSPLDASLTYQ